MYAPRPFLRRALGAACAALALSAAVPASSASPAADPAKTMRVAMAIAETSFDPAFASDAASDAIIANVFETLLDYDYLARPVLLVPVTAEAMPTVADGGRSYTFRIRKGILFTPDPAFKGKPRELVAADYAYSFKRILDPAIKSPWLWLLDGKLVGGDEARAHAQKTGKFDYDAPLPGLEVVDRHTLRIRLKAPDYRFPYALAVQNLGAMAREVVEAYGNDIGAHPVGTGPYRLGEYRRSARIVLEANAAYRETTYAPAGPVPAALQPVAAAMKGKRLPFAGRIEVQIIEEGQARWLAFLNRELDFLDSCRRVHRAGAGLWPAEARPRGKGHRPRDAAATEHLLDLLQHEGSGRRRLYAGEDRAAPRDRARLQRRRADPRHRQGPRGSGAEPHSPGHRRLQPEVQEHGAALRPGCRTRAARPLRLQGPRRRRVSRGAGRQAAGAGTLVDAGLRRAPGRRAVEEEHGCDRAAHGVQEGQAAGAAQDGATGQDPDARRRLERRLSGRGELHAVALRAQRGAGEPGAVRPARVQPALRPGAHAARFAGTDGAVRPDDRTDASRTRRGG